MIHFFLLPGRMGRERNCELWTAEKFAFSLQSIAKIFNRSHQHYLLSDYRFIIVFHLLYFSVNFDFKNSSLDLDVANS